MDFRTSKPPTFEIKGVEYMICGTNLETNLVNVKNINSGNYKEIDFYKLQKLIENESNK